VRLVVVGVCLAELHAQRVDVLPERSEQRRQECHRRGDRDQHGDRRGVAHVADERDAREDQGHQRDHHGDPREDDRAARRGGGSRDRLAHLHAVLELELVAGDDEQRVVDPDAEADHRRQRRRDARHLDDVAEQLDDRQRRDQPEHRRHDRQDHRRDRAEGEHQDHDRRREADRLARLCVGLGDRLAEVAAGGDLEPGLLRGALRVDDLLGLVVGEVALALGQGDRDVGDLLVLADRVFGRLAERADRALDDVHLPQRLDRVLNGLLVLRVGDLPGLGLHDDRVGAVGLVGQMVRQQVLGVGRAGAGEGEVVARLLADDVGDRGDGDHGGHPQPDYGPMVAATEATEPVERASHTEPGRLLRD
jgi:hypothetical protein